MNKGYISKEKVNLLACFCNIIVSNETIFASQLKPKETKKKMPSKKYM
jgi:hypothetical protein